MLPSFDEKRECGVPVSGMTPMADELGKKIKQCEVVGQAVPLEWLKDFQKQLHDVEMAAWERDMGDNV